MMVRSGNWSNSSLVINRSAWILASAAAMKKIGGEQRNGEETHLKHTPSVLDPA
jgi:hypothetical protein